MLCLCHYGPALLRVCFQTNLGRENSASYLLGFSFSYYFFIFFQTCEPAESSKSWNVIGSESERNFTILPADPGGIVSSFIHKFVCCLWMSKNRQFPTAFFS